MLKQKNIRKNGGQAIFASVMFFLFTSTLVIFGITTPVLKRTQIAHDFFRSKESFYLSEALHEDVLYRIISGQSYTSPEVLTMGSNSASTTITDVSGGIEIVSRGNSNQRFRSNKTRLTLGGGTAFHYGMQSGIGGIILENTSSVRGNLYANGTIEGAGNYVYGDVVSAGSSGLIDDVHATGSAYAKTIRDSTVDRNAYYQTITGSTVTGTSYPGSSNQPTTTLSITDDQVSDWETDAVTGGTHTSPCPYNINSDVTLGPIKINCDLNISNNPTVTLTGNIWVSGNINISNTAILRISPSLGNKSVAIVADNPSDRITSSKIDLQNSTLYYGSGSSASYILFISQNNSAEIGGSEIAMTVKNYVDGDLLLFSGHGLVQLENNIGIKELSAYKIKLKNSAEVIYETGLANLLFDAGPSGGYSIDTWLEVE